MKRYHSTWQYDQDGSADLLTAEEWLLEEAAVEAATGQKPAEGAPSRSRILRDIAEEIGRLRRDREQLTEAYTAVSLQRDDAARDVERFDFAMEHILSLQCYRTGDVVVVEYRDPWIGGGKHTGTGRTPRAALDDARGLAPRPEPDRKWTRFDATTDEEIARQIASDPDTAPELDDNWWHAATVDAWRRMAAEQPPRRNVWNAWSAGAWMAGRDAAAPETAGVLALARECAERDRTASQAQWHMRLNGPLLALTRALYAEPKRAEDVDNALRDLAARALAWLHERARGEAAR